MLIEASVIVLVSVIIGFIMGFKSANPNKTIITRDPSMGPTEDDGGDLWRDAMEAPPEAEERVKTR